MLDWLININKDFPEFWKTYLSKFEKKSKRFVVLSTETTGLNPEKDVILSLKEILKRKQYLAVPKLRFVQSKALKLIPY